MRNAARAILLLTAAVSIAGCGDDSARFRAGVARLEVRWMGPAAAWKSKPIGTAFFVGDQGYLLTARHVAEHGRTALEDLGGRLPARLVAIQPGSESVDVAIVAEDPEADVALLRVKGANHQDGRSLRRSAPPAQSEVALAGFPIGAPGLVVQRGRLLDPGSHGLTAEDFRSREGWTMLAEGDLLPASVVAEVGHSGGPLFLAETGEVLGLCSASLLRADPNDDTRLALIVPAPRIARFLDAQGVSP
jgi:S1-C subfamily serine protease